MSWGPEFYFSLWPGHLDLLLDSCFKYSFGSILLPRLGGPEFYSNLWRSHLDVLLDNCFNYYFGTTLLQCFGVLNSIPASGYVILVTHLFQLFFFW